MQQIEMDDPSKREFASYRSYGEFARRVRHQSRYVWDEHVKAFIGTVLATLKDRDVVLKKGTPLYRAQLGIDYVSFDKNRPDEPSGYNAARMKPRPNRSTEGRANAAGVSVLYLGTTEQNVISEVRPWVGAEISVAQFELKRNLRTLDLTRGHGKSSLTMLVDHLVNGTPLTTEQRETAVWIDIDNAFSRPVTKTDDAADYVPTQILAEVFRSAGYDAIGYKSQFGENGFNIIVFNPDDADVLNCAPYQVKRLDVSFEEMGNRWYRSEKVRKAKSSSKRRSAEASPKQV